MNLYFIIARYVIHFIHSFMFPTKTLPISIMTLQETEFIDYLRNKKQHWIGHRPVFNRPQHHFRKEVPKELWQSEPVCREYVRLFPRTLYSIPYDMRTLEVCFAAVDCDGRNLRTVPSHFRIYEMCKRAIASNGRALQFVPEWHMNRQFCEDAIGNRVYAFRHVPNRYKNLEMCIDVVERAGELLQYVPRSFTTTTLCRVAVENLTVHKCSRFKNEWIPEHVFSEELLLSIFRHMVFDDSLIKRIPTPLLNRCILRIAFEHYPSPYIKELLKSCTI